MDKNLKRLTIWTSDRDLELGDISGLLTLDYTKEIPYLINRVLTRNDKIIFNRWCPYKEELGLGIHGVEIGQSLIQAIATRAYFETYSSERHAIVDDVVLPRDYRISSHEQPVFFFVVSGRVYAAVVGSEYIDNKIRSNLMGASRTRDTRYEGWGRILFKDIPAYTFSVDFFYWLILKQNQIITAGDYEINLSDIHSLDQSSERNDVSQTVKGANLTDEPMATTGLSVDSDVKAVGITVTIPDATLKINILQNGECHIDQLISRVIGPRGEFLFVDDNLEFVTLFIYVILLPALNQEYNSDVRDGRWTTRHRETARKLWALGVINELCSENRLSIADVTGVEWFRARAVGTP